MRRGAGSAVAEARWVVPETGPVAERVAEAGGELEPLGDGRAELLVSRTVTPEGRSRVAVAGRSVPVGVLQDLGDDLVAVHGQSEQLRLKSPAAQREMLDRFAGPVVAELLADYGQVWRRWQVDRAELEHLTGDRDARAAEAGDLRAALAEIEGVAPQPGEDDELAALAERLGAQDELRVAAATAHERAVGRGRRGDRRAHPARRSAPRPGAHRLARSGARGDRRERRDGRLARRRRLRRAGVLPLRPRPRRARPARGRRSSGSTSSPSCSAAYGPTLEDVLASAEAGSRRAPRARRRHRPHRRARAAGRGGRAPGRASSRPAVRSPRAEAAERLGDRGDRRARRPRHGQRGRPRRRREAATELTASGRDAVQLLLQPHPGAEPRAARRGASGGELSRVMLALEVVLAGSDPVPTFVFDEVDAGIGGAAAIEVGRRLARLAASSQVIAVTHLAQVAAFATNHLRVLKDSDGGVTVSTVEQPRRRRARRRDGAAAVRPHDQRFRPRPRARSCSISRARSGPPRMIEVRGRQSSRG